MIARDELWTRWRVRAGYPVALACFWFARPTPKSLTLGAALAALGLLLRAAAAGHLRKHDALATTGPYAHTRNPLYLGSAVMAAGFAVAAHSWIAVFILTGYFVLFYPAVMRREEQELRARYGRAFDEYAGRVPLFWPRGKPVEISGPTGGGGFSWTLYRRNREYRAALGYLFIIILLIFIVYLRR